jgi:SAM-dependent methyltransferase
MKRYCRAGRDMVLKDFRYRSDYNRIKKVLQIFAEFDNVHKILDIGCDNGNLSNEIKIAARASEIFGIDMNGNALKSAQKKEIKVFKVDIDREFLPFDDAFFDAIYCGEVIEHVHDTDHLLDEIYRTLKVGGICVIDTPNLSSWHNKIELLFGFQPSYTQVSKLYNVGKIINVPGACGSDSHLHHWVFTYRALWELIKIHDFTILETYGASDSNIFFPINIIENLFSSMPTLSTFIIFKIKK